MVKNKAQTVRRIYGLCLTVLTVVVAVLFIVQIWLLFRATENSPYTVETVSKRFSQIAIPFYLWIAAIICGGVLAYAFPEEKEVPKAFVDTRMLLSRLKARLPENDGGMVEVKCEKNLRNAIWGACAALSIVMTVIAVVFLLNTEYVATFDGAFFASHVEAEKLLKLTPGILLCLCACVGALIYQSYSLKKELALVKKVMAESAKRGVKLEKADKKQTFSDKIIAKFAFLTTGKAVLVTRLVVAAVGIILLIVGICGDGMAEVLTKAINICTQCIGLG